MHHILQYGRKFFPSLLLPFLSLSFLCGCAIFSDDEMESDLTVDELQMKMHQAFDPDGNYRKATSYVMRQTVSESGFFRNKENLVEVKLKQPDQVKITTYENNVPMTELIFNSQAAWAIDYSKRSVVPVTGENYERLKTMYLLYDPDCMLKDIFAEVRISLVTSGNEEFYKLHCISKYEGVAPLDIYVGKNNFLTAKLSTIFTLNNRRESYKSEIISYGLYDGVMIPRETEVDFGGRRSTARVVEYKLNANLTDADFMPPIFRKP